MLTGGKSSSMNSRVELVHVDWWEELVRMNSRVELVHVDWWEELVRMKS